MKIKRLLITPIFGFSLMLGGCFDNGTQESQPQANENTGGPIKETISSIGHFLIIDDPQEINAISELSDGITILTDKESDYSLLKSNLAKNLHRFRASTRTSRHIPKAMIILSEGVVINRKRTREAITNIGRALIVDTNKLDDIEELTLGILKNSWKNIEDASTNNTFDLAWRQFSPGYHPSQLEVNNRRTVRNNNRKSEEEGFEFLEYEAKYPGYLFIKNYSEQEERAMMFSLLLADRSYCELRKVLTVDAWLNKKAQYLVRQMARLSIYPTSINCVKTEPKTDF